MYSIVIPHLSTNRDIEKCLHYLSENSLYPHEIIEILNETDVYHAFNQGVYRAKYDTVVLLSSDMIVSKHWDRLIPIYSNEKTVLTGYVVERSPGKMNQGPECIKYDCGDSDTFDYNRFQDWVDNQDCPEAKFNDLGWYQPLVINKRSFVTYPNLHKFPHAQNDCTLILDLLPKLGYKFIKIDMWIYHMHKSTKLPKKRAIFTYSNFQVDTKIVEYQKLVVDRLNSVPHTTYEYLRYNAPDGVVWPDAVIDHGFRSLFYERDFDTILLLDIDCIPLNSRSLHYVFERAEQGVLIGNIQRANHIENNQHVYIAPSAMCVSRETYEKLGKPSFAPNSMGDVAEFITYVAEQRSIPMEMFIPNSYEKLPHQRDTPWPLAPDMPEYGIGTTYVDSSGREMFYHLFQSSIAKHDELFYNKCKSVLTKAAGI